MTRHCNFIELAIAKIVRVRREGGTSCVMLPHPITGEPVVQEIDQRRADEMIAWLCDQVIADIAKRMQEGHPVSPNERQDLKRHRKQVPHSFIWEETAGVHWLLPLNAYGAPITDPAAWIHPAAHPLEYDIDWGLSAHESITQSTGNGIVRLPIDADLLSLWTRLDHQTADMLATRPRRRSARDERRHSLPYGVWTRASGVEVVFNRLYQAIYARTASGVCIRSPAPPAWVPHISERWFYHDGHSEAQSRRRAKAALRAFIAGNPLP